MSSAKLGWFLRICALAGLVCLLIFVLVFTDGGYAHAAPVFQDTPGYDSPTDSAQSTDSGYNPPETETPSNQTTPQPTSQQSSTPTIKATNTETGTPRPDVFRTEDSEMNNALTTPLVTETGAASITPYQTATVTKTLLLARTPAAAKKKGGFAPDWGLFWIGFSIPILGACGLVLYLLDRRPDLFKHR